MDVGRKLPSFCLDGRDGDITLDGGPHGRPSKWLKGHPIHERDCQQGNCKDYQADGRSRKHHRARKRGKADEYASGLDRVATRDASGGNQRRPERD